ncbi:MAG: T9SS type A sorting domain-containing protein [Saprospiraceae bacterium]
MSPFIDILISPVVKNSPDLYIGDVNKVIYGPGYPFSSGGFFCDRDFVFGNLPKNYVQANNGNANNEFIHMGSAPSNVECIFLPLRSPLKVGKDYKIRFSKFSGCSNRVNFAFSIDQPCKRPAILAGLISGTNIGCPGFNPQIVGKDFTGSPVNPPTWETLDFNFNAADASNYVTIFQNPASFLIPAIKSNYARSLYLDDIEITVLNAPQITIVPTIEKRCIGGNVEISYEICVVNNSSGTITLTPKLPTNSGLTFSSSLNSGFPNGVPITISLPSNGQNCIVKKIIYEASSLIPVNTVVNIGLDIDPCLTSCIDVTMQAGLPVNADFTIIAPELCATISLVADNTVNGSGTTHDWVIKQGTGNPMNLGSGNSATASVSAGLTYDITHTVSNLCGSRTITKTIVIPTNPIITIIENSNIAANDGIICAGDDVTLSVPSVIGQTYSWNTGNTSNLIIEKPFVSITTYSVTISSASGCTATASKDITVLQNPIISDITVTENSNIANDKIVCAGADVTLSVAAVTGQTYLWNTGKTTNLIIEKPFVSITTYSVTTLAANGCTATASKDITVFQYPNISDITVSENSGIPNDDTICAGASAMLSVTNSNVYTYLWSTQAITSSITVSPTITTVYQLTITASSNSCVTIPPAKTITVEPTLSSSFTYAINCPITSFVAVNEGGHNWSITNSAGATWASTVFNPSFTLPNGSYHVSHTIANYCGTSTQQQEITVSCQETEQCPCSGSSYSIFDASGVKLLSNTALFNQSPSGAHHGGCITVTGKLVIDQEFQFFDMEFIMQPGSEIVVDNTGYTHFHHCNIYGCLKRWKGIELKASNHADFTENTIQDAENAITIRESTTGVVQGNLFNRNYIGLNLESTSFFYGGSTLMNIMANTFDATYPLLPPFVLTNSNNTPNGYAGIKLSFISAEVGIPGGIITASTNTFKHLRNGIMSFYSQLTARDLVIKDLVNDANTDHDKPILSLAEVQSLYHTGIFGLQSQIKISKSTIGDPNGFVPSPSKGIHLQGSLGFDMQESKIISNHTSILNSNSNAGFYAINDNQVSTNRYGYRMFESQNAAINILNNSNSNNFATVRNNVNPMAFYTSSTVSGGKGIKNILNNSIFLSGNFVGLNVLVERNNNIYNNDITLITHSTNSSGIKIEGSDKNVIVNNLIGSTSLSAWRGISATSTQNTSFCCNLPVHLAIGINFNGNCANTRLYKTDLRGENSIGLHLDNGAIIGLQTNNENVFRPGSNNTIPAKHESGNSAQVNLSKFIVKNNPINYPAGILSNGLQWFDPKIPGNPVYCQTGTSAECGFQLSSGGGSNLSDGASFLLQAYAEGIPIGYYSDYQQWRGGFWSWDLLESHPEYLELNSVVDNYYDVLDNSNIHRFYDVDKLLDEINSPTTTQKQTLEALGVQDVAINLELNGIDIALLSDTITPSDSISKFSRRGELLNLKWDHFMTRRSINDAIKTSNTAVIARAYEKNQAIIPINLYEYNEKRINRIFLNTLAKDIYDIPEDDRDFINYLAPLCPMIIGNAVYKARVLRNLYLADQIYEDACEPAQPNMQRIAKVETIATTHQEKVHIYPNPSSDKITISCERNDAYTVILRDMTGRIIGQHSINNGFGDISVSNLNNGLIICELWTNNQCVANQKIVIIH